MAENPYVGLIEDSTIFQQEEARIQGEIAAQTDSPDQYAQHTKLARQTGLPVATVQHNADPVRRRVRANEYAGLIADDPKLQLYMAQRPESLGVHSDDLRGTSYMGLVMEVLSAGQANTKVADIGGSLWLDGGEISPADAHALARFQWQARHANENFGYTGISSVPFSVARFLPSIWGGFVKAQKLGLATGGAYATLTALAGQAGPQAATPEEIVTVPGAFLTGYGWGAWAGFADYAFWQELGGAYVEYLNVRDPETGARLDPYAAWTAALLTGIVAGGAETAGAKILATMAGGGKLMKLLAREPLKKALARPTVAQAFGRFGRRWAGAVTGESLTEVFQEAVAMANGEFAKMATETIAERQNPAAPPPQFERVPGSEWRDRLVHIAVDTAKATAVIGMGGATTHASVDVYAAHRARRSEALMREMVEKTENSPVFKRYRDEFEQWVEERSQDGADPSVYIDAAGITAYAHSQGLNPAELLAPLGVEAQHIVDALARRGDVIVPLSKIAVGLAGNDHRDQILQNIREHPGAPTPLETERIIGREQELFDQAAEEDAVTDSELQQISESAERVRADILERIQAMPQQDADTAAQQADLWRAFYRTQALRTGRDPWELYQSMPTFIESAAGGAQIGGQAFRQAAFHGTGVRGIQRMLMERVASGTGALEQGWGIYSAEERQVAETYREELARSRQRRERPRLQGEPVAAMRRLATRVRETAADRRQLGPEQRGLPEHLQSLDMLALEVQEAIDAGDTARGTQLLERAAQLSVPLEGIRHEETGQVYQLEIPDREELMDWDARFSQMPAAMQAKLEEAVRAAGMPQGVRTFGEDPTGQQIYNDLALTWGRPGNRAARRRASMTLLRAGIPGLMYWDQESRAAGRGTRNFVVWDEERIEITDTYYQRGRDGEPVSPFRVPSGADARLRRLLKRKKGVGAPKNRRKTLHLADGTTLTVGALNVGDWIKRIRQTTSVDDIHAFRAWYRQVMSAFEGATGEHIEAWAVAWMRAQQAASPSKALLDMMRVREQVISGAEGAKGGLADSALRAFWRAIETGDPDALAEISGGAQKLYDFVDSMMGKTTRTWMGDDERGGAPAVIDRHTSRDVGFVDQALLEALRRRGVKESELKGIEVDLKATPTEAQYEHGREFLTRVADHLNKKNMWGGGWTPAEVQATGWMALLNQLGKGAETADLAIARQTRQLSTALVFGEGAPYNTIFSEFLGLPWDAQQRVTDRVTRRALELVQRMVGDPPVRSVETGAGGWLDYDAEPSTQIQILGSPEAAEALADALGYLLQQTGVRIERSVPMTPKGEVPAGTNSWFVDLVDVGEGRLGEAGVQSKFWEHLRRVAPDLEAGFHPITENGQPGIRIGVDYKMFPGRTGADKLDSLVAKAFLEAAEATEADLGIELNLEHAISPGQASERNNDWNENPNGESYESRIEGRFGPDASADLRDHRWQIEIELKKGIREEQARAERGAILPDRFFQPAPAEPTAPPRAETEFVGGEALVRLFKDSDMSSLLHEGGHIFLRMFESIANNPNAPEQTRRDWRTLLDAARRARPGTEPGRALTEEQVEWIVEEQWEKRYLARGQAPSHDLRGAFLAFKAWLLQVYQSLRGREIEIDPEVAAVFDRWLATEQEIANLEQSREFQPSFTDAQQAGVSEQEWADYQERIRQSAVQARTDTMSEALEVELREERRWWRAQRDEIEAGVTSDVNAQPVHQASHWLRTGEWLAGTPDVEIPHAKLSRQWIVDTYGKQGAKPFLAALARGKGTLYSTEEGAYTGDELAGLFGFTSGDELVRALAASPDRDQVIRDRTEAALRGLAETRENAPERAHQAVHTDARGELLAQELTWLAQRSEEISREPRVPPPATEEAAEAAPEGEVVRQPGREPTKTELALRKARDEARERAVEAERQLREGRRASARAWGTAAGRARREARAEAADLREALRVNVNDARRVAQERVLDLRRMDLRPDTYSGTERRAASECQQAIAALQDPRVPLEERAELIDRAVEAKRVQLVNHFMFREATKAKAQTERDVRWLSQFQTDKKRAEYGLLGGEPRGYLDRIDELMEKFDLKARPTNKEVEERTQFLEWMKGEEEAGHEVLYPERFLAQGVISSKEMTVRDVYDLRDTVKHLDHQAKRKKKLLSRKDKIDRKQATSELAGRAYQTHTALAVKQKDRWPTLLEATRDFVGGLDASLLKIEQLIEWLDGKDPDGPWRRYIWNPIADAQAAYYKYVDDKVAQFELIMNHLDQKHRDWLNRDIFIRELGTKQKPAGESYKGFELIAMACNLGTESNLKKMLAGHGWELDQVMTVLNRELSDQHWEVVQRIWGLLESMWPDIEANEKAISGLGPKKLEKRAFATAGGRQMNGGYYPMVYDPLENNRIYHYVQASEALYEYNWGKPETEHGFTESRSEHFAAPLLFDLRTVPNHIARVAHDLSHRRTLMDVYNLLKDPEVQGAITDTLGRHYADQFIPWLRGIANQVAPDRELAGWERVLRKLRYNTTIMAMGWKATTMFSQVAGYFNSLEWLMNHGDRRGHYWMLMGINHLRKNRAQAYKMVMELSSEMAHRMRTLDREVAENTARLQGQDSKVAWVQRNAFIGIGVMDMAVSLPTWIAAYHQTLHAGHSKEVAVRTADAAVRMSQGAGGRKDLSSFARGGAKNSEWQKAAGMFMSYFSALYSRQRNAYYELRKTGREQGVASKEFVADFGRWLMKQMYLVIFPSIAAELLSGRTPDPDDEETWVDWMIKKSIAGNFASIPIIRDAVGSAITGFEYQPTPLTSAAKSALQAFQSVSGAFGEDGEWELDKIIRHTTRTAGYAIGLPLMQPVDISGFQIVEMLTGDREASFHDLIFRGERE